MNIYKQLAGQTAIYGLSSIVGRFLNFLLVPLYTRVFDQGEYGVVTQLYAYVAFFNIIFTYGMETAFFRFFQSEKGHSRVYSTGLISVLASSVIFAFLIISFSDFISAKIFSEGISASVTGQDRYSDYIKIFAGILAFDAITAIPFALLRQQNKAKRFAFIRLINIGINIGLNLFFLVACPLLIKNEAYSWISSIYDPSIGIGYVFISGLVSSVITFILLLPEIFKFTFAFDSALWKQMFVYAFPIMIAGFAGMINETFDRVMIPYLITDKSNVLAQLGIYGACYKLSIIMTLFVQTFRYAAEPFFFNHASKENPQQVYSFVMNMFVIVCSAIFLGVMLYIDWFKYFIGPDFWAGLQIVPILLIANLCLGIYYNLSIWYKLTSKTKWGAWLSVIGAIITIVFNILLIPVLGITGAAWATLICYFSMMVISYLLGQRHFPVKYDVRSFFYYVVLAIVIWCMSVFVQNNMNLSGKIMLVVNTIFLFLFVWMVWIKERRKNSYLRRE